MTFCTVEGTLSTVKKQFERQPAVAPERRKVSDGFATLEHFESVVWSILYKMLLIIL